MWVLRKMEGPLYVGVALGWVTTIADNGRG